MSATSTITSTLSSIVTEIPTRTITTTSARSTLVSTLFSTTTSFVLTTVTQTPTTPPEPALDTKLDPGFAVLGVVLILTGLPSAFLGHKNRWSSYFLTGFYTLAIVCLSLILKFGVLAAVNPPSRTLRGLFVLSCSIAGLGGGAICILFWNQARYFVGGLGGFAFGLWIQCFRNGGVIRSIGLRWILYISCAVVGFVMCTVPKIHYHVLLGSTSMVGATAFMLGVDCFTRAGLKEFYVYNLGFRDLFPKFVNKPFPVSQTMQIELGLIAACGLAGAAIQLRVLALLKIKLKQIKEDQKRRDEEIEAQAAERFKEIDRDLTEWEKEHGSGFTRPKLQSPDTAARSDDTLIGRRARAASDLSDFRAAPRELERDHPLKDDRGQTAGLLPPMNLGDDIEGALPTHFVSGDVAGLARSHSDVSGRSQPASNKDAILADIEEIRKSIDWLKQGVSPNGSTSGSNPRSRKQSSASYGASQEADNALRPDYLALSARPRVQSMDLSLHLDSADPLSGGRRLGRPTSQPLRDEEWDAYVQERQLFTPPSGPTTPIPTTSTRPLSAAPLVDIPDAVQKALENRKRRESALEIAARREDSPELIEPDGAPAMEPSPARTSNAPIQILPPAKKASETAEVPRTRTYEELAERHRRKMRELQQPLTNAEKNQAKLESARSRWERSMHVEKLEFDQRQAEKLAAAKAKDKRTAPGQTSSKDRASRDQKGQRRSSSGLTSQQLASIPAQSGHTRRSSTAKVLQWQQMQQGEVDLEQGRVSMAPSRARATSPDDSGNQDVPLPGSERSSRPPRNFSGPVIPRR